MAPRLPFHLYVTDPLATRTPRARRAGAGVGSQKSATAANVADSMAGL